MKKTRVVLCLFLAFVLCFTMGTTIVSAESFSMENAPVITLGEPFAIDVKKTTESQTEADEVYVGKFIPEETGSYKLTFDTVFDPGQTSEEQWLPLSSLQVKKMMNPVELPCVFLPRE